MKKTICFDDLNEEQKKAIEILNSGVNVILSGVGGSGKTAVINCFREMNKDKNILLCSPTGNAACLIGGCTIHSAFKFKPKPYSIHDSITPSDVLMKSDIIIVDESSMVRYDLFYAMTVAIKKAEKACGKKKQLICVGDFYQLPPVLPDKDGQALASAWTNTFNVLGGYMFLSPMFAKMDFTFVNLEKSMRQTDEEFVASLNEIRAGYTTSIKYINEHSSKMEPHGAIYICATNRQADKINQANLDSLPGDIKVYMARDTGKVNDADRPSPKKLELKTNARVRMTRNGDFYTNGSQGTVTALSDDMIKIMLDSGIEIDCRRELFEFLKPVVVSINGKSVIEMVSDSSTEQFPVALAYAITVHRSQGQTFSAVVFNPEGVWSFGQTYVALSRCTCIESLHLSVPLKPKHIIASHIVSDFYKTGGNIDRSLFQKFDATFENEYDSLISFSQFEIPVFDKEDGDDKDDDDIFATPPKRNTDVKATTDKKKTMASFNDIGDFNIPGRDKLSSYINEEIIDFLRNYDSYKTMGINSVPATILYGPPGSGKTYAVSKLSDHLGIPCFKINSDTVASPYIHDTAKKISEVFRDAIDSAPSLLVLDELEAYVPNRNANVWHHTVEEVDEFLRMIPEAIASNVIIFGMTNAPESIDPAALRKGRFDSKLEITMPSVSEIIDVLESELASRPHCKDLKLSAIAEKLVGHQLCDIGYVINQAARICVRKKESKISQLHLEEGLKKLSSN